MENDREDIAKLVVHIDYMRKQLDDLSETMKTMATKDDIAALEGRLRKEIDENKPSAMFWTITKVCAGLVSIAAAVGLLIAIMKAFNV